MNPYLTRNFIASVFALTGLVVMACGKSQSDKDEPRLPLESVPIVGGVGQKHHLVVARTNAQLTLDQQDSLLQLDANANIAGIKVLSTQNLTVEAPSCSDNICSVPYIQSVSTGEKDEISMTLRILDANGVEWKAVQAMVPVDPLQVSELPTFVPNFGKTVSLTIPVSYSDRPNFKAPELTQVEATGGRIEAASCQPGRCQLDFTYDSFNVQPTIRFAVKDDIRSSQVYTITPQPETFTFRQRSVMVIDGTIQFKVQKGVDYNSSWNRPVHAIKVKNTKDLTAKSFNCTTDSCLADLTIPVMGSHPALEYSLLSFGHESAVRRQEMTRTTPVFRSLIKEAVIEYGKDNLITLRPGQDYVSDHGIVPSALRIKYPGHANSTVTNAKCDASGICSFNLKHDSSSASFTLDYTLVRGTFESPRFTLNFRPYVVASSTRISAWKKKPEAWNELVLEPGKDMDYVSEDGQVATAIIVESSENLSFKNSSGFGENVFNCDAAGVCRAWVRANPYSYSSTISYRVRTADHVSQSVQRIVDIKHDSVHFLKIARNVAYRKVQLADATSNLYRFDLSFSHGVDYTSRFPATHLLVELEDDDRITLDTPHEKEGTKLVIKCNEVCPLSGGFVSENLQKSMRVTFRNEYTQDEYGDTLFLIDENHASIFPDMVSYKAVSMKDGTHATITLEKGPELGYVGDKLAKAIRLRSSEGITFTQAITGKDRFGNYWEFPCNEQGKCVVQGTVSDLYIYLSYSFVDVDGASSIQRNVILSTPANFAPPIKAYAAIQSEHVDLNVYFVTGAESGGSVEILGRQGEVLGTLYCESTAHCKGRIKLSTPLNKVNDTLVMSYRRVPKEGSKSNEGALTLTGVSTYRLKKDLVKTAQKLEGRRVKFAIHLADLDILENSSNSLPLDSKTILSFDATGIIVSRKTCDKDQCEFTLVIAPDSVSSLKVGVSRPHEYSSQSIFLDSSLTLQLGTGN